MTLGHLVHRTRYKIAAVGLATTAFAATTVGAVGYSDPAAPAKAPFSGEPLELALNLLTSPQEGKPTVRISTMGSGSWICSPAGFGQRSRCHRN